MSHNKELNEFVSEPFVGIPLQFTENANVAISWNEIPETNNLPVCLQTFSHVPQAMSAESIHEARQLLNCPIFARTTATSVSRQTNSTVPILQPLRPQQNSLSIPTLSATKSSGNKLKHIVIFILLCQNCFYFVKV